MVSFDLLGTGPSCWLHAWCARSAPSFLTSFILCIMRAARPMLCLCLRTRCLLCVHACPAASMPASSCLVCHLLCSCAACHLLCCLSAFSYSYILILLPIPLSTPLFSLHPTSSSAFLAHHLPCACLPACMPIALALYMPAALYPPACAACSCLLC